MDGPQPGAESLEALIVGSLPANERRLLGAAAALRYITPELARLVTGSDEGVELLASHPLVHPCPGAPVGEQWVIPESLRRQLVQGEEGRAASAWQRVAGCDDELESVYAQLSVNATRTAGLERLEALFASAIAQRPPAVGRAHDLLGLLQEWPVRDHAEALELHKRLTPRLRRQSRAIRDREASDGYVERDFESDALQRLFAGGEPWVLHLHAPGGRGKSMFLKNLLGRTCPALDHPVARVDFDHIDRLGLNTTQPWRLLLTMARQLNTQLPGQPFELLLATYGHLRAATFADVVPVRQLSHSAEESSTDEEFVRLAAADVPRRFRTELANAAPGGIVVIALDTIENVQQADGADLEAVLDALGEVRSGGDATTDSGVTGLRLVLSGRYDLDSTRQQPGGPPLQRSARFHDRFMGPGTVIAGEGISIGAEAIGIEVPEFSDDEATRFLADTDRPDVVAAVVRRSEGNPMKLALFRECLKDNPRTTAADIEGLESVELAYLVTRVVDRITNPLVQWVLRWGALMKLLTREAVDQVIWPALETLAERGTTYDSAPLDTPSMPPVAAGAERWPIPAAAHVRRPGAADQTWDELLSYAAGSSWVSSLDNLPNAVQFHPEVREPLRGMLRAAGDPVFDDIHRRALHYWARRADQTTGAARAEALRSVVFHAYESPRADVSGDERWLALIADPTLDRFERGEIADEVIAVSVRRAGGGRRPPDAVTLGYAHLERAEAMIHDAAVAGRSLDEARLSSHRYAVPDDVRRAEPRRALFLDAAMALTLSDVAGAWEMLDAALSHPAPQESRGAAHLELIVEWADRSEPPRAAIGTARRLAAEAAGGRWAARAARPLARVLIATEQWREALAVATGTGDAQLIGQALLGLGRVREILENPMFSAVARATAALIDLDAERALKELDSAFPASRSASPAPEVSLLRGKAHTLRRENDPARAALSDAASGTDAGVALEASLWLSRLMAATGHHDLSTANLSRSFQRGDTVGRSRAEALEAVVDRDTDRSRSLGELSRAYHDLAESGWAPPSVRVEIECARLSVLGPTADRLAELARALEAVDDPASRLRALQWLAEVPASAEPAPEAVVRQLRDATRIEVTPETPAALLLAQAELERVLGYPERSAELLEALQHAHAEDRRTLGVTVRDAMHRLSTESTGWESFTTAAGDTPAHSESAAPDPHTRTIHISSLPDGGMLLVDVDSGARTRTETEVSDVLSDGHYALAADPAGVAEGLGAALAVGDAARWLDQSADTVLALDIRDEAAARWPWELSSMGGRPMAARQRGVVVRTGRRASVSPEEEAVRSTEAYVAILNERHDYGHSAGMLSDAYGRRARHGDPYGLAEGELRRLGPSTSIVHLVAEPIERRRAPALQLADDHLTPERLAGAIGHRRPALLILDLALGDSPSIAAEQLMLANAFCWHLIRNAPAVSAVCGSFSAAPDPSGRLALLLSGLRGGMPLADVVGLLQRHRHRPFRNEHLRSFVSLNSEAFQRRFVLEGD
ncbi:hypothetical protein [Microbacterium sp. ProA8]|uniref:hypothetical protein n=1 Tax=Microbacterium chionoecetis TaxID=3153754 RepID=UPI003265DA8D